MLFILLKLFCSVFAQYLVVSFAFSVYELLIWIDVFCSFFYKLLYFLIVLKYLLNFPGCKRREKWTHC